MCGVCGARSGVDWAASLLGSLPARSAAARVVLAAAGRPVDVRAVTGGWTVRRPTGAGLVVDTLTALVGAVGARADAGVDLPGVPGAALPGPDRRRPVVLVHGPPAGREGVVDAGAAGWAERLLGDVSAPCVVATPDDPRPVLEALLSDPLRRHVRVTGLESATLPGWGEVTGPLPDVPARVLPAQVPALAALLAVRLSGRPSGERSRTRVAVGGTAVVLDALGSTALGVGVLGRTGSPRPASTQPALAQAGAGPRPSRQRAASSDGL